MKDLVGKDLKPNDKVIAVYDTVIHVCTITKLGKKNAQVKLYRNLDVYVWIAPYKLVKVPKKTKPTTSFIEMLRRKRPSCQSDS